VKNSGKYVPWRSGAYSYGDSPGFSPDSLFIRWDDSLKSRFQRNLTRDNGTGFGDGNQQLKRSDVLSLAE